MQNPTPTFMQIISTDYLAQNLFLLIFGPWVIFLVDSLLTKDPSIVLIIFAALCTPLGLYFFTRRYRAIMSTFTNGQETAGRIISVNTLSTGEKRKDYILEYEYTFEGQAYQHRNRVKKNDIARDLRNGQSVVLIVNAQDPNIAFIKDMYLANL